jgi:hypothetical protein
LACLGLSSGIARRRSVSRLGTHPAVGRFRHRATPAASRLGTHPAVGCFRHRATPAASRLGTHPAVGCFRHRATPAVSRLGTHQRSALFPVQAPPHGARDLRVTCIRRRRHQRYEHAPRGRPTRSVMSPNEHRHCRWQRLDRPQLLVQLAPSRLSVQVLLVRGGDGNCDGARRDPSTTPSRARRTSAFR